MSNLYQYNGEKWVEISKNGKDAKVDYDFIISQIPKPKDGKDITQVKPELLAESLNSLKNVINVEVIKGAVSRKDLDNQDKKVLEGMARVDGRIKLIDQRWGAHGGGLSKVSHDATLTGNGTPIDPLSVVGGGAIPTFLTVRAATTAVNAYLNPYPVYDNGVAGVGATLTGSPDGALDPIDGITLNVGDRFLVRNLIFPIQNGVYILNDAGSVSSPWIATRTTDADETSEIFPQTVLVTEGTVNAGLKFQQRTTNPVIGTNPITYYDYLFYDDVGGLSIDTLNRGLSDSTGSLAATWNYRQLYNATGYTVDWGYAILNYAGFQSLNWYTRLGFDSTGNQAFDYSGDTAHFEIGGNTGGLNKPQLQLFPDPSYDHTSFIGEGGLLNDGTGLWFRSGGVNYNLLSSVIDTSGSVAVNVATTAVLNDTPVYNNGTAGVGATLTAVSAALSNIDGIALNNGDTVLVKNQVSQLENGVYDVTQNTAPYILTRSVSADETSEFDPQIIIPTGGTVNESIIFGQQTANPVIGTDPIVYSSPTSTNVTQNTSGTQVSGQIPFWNTAARKLSKGGAQLFWDNTNNYLGIGSTLAPVSALTVTKQFASSVTTQVTSSFFTYGDTVRNVYKRANGTIASPTQVLSAEILGFVGFGGYQSGGAFSAANAAIFATASENYTSTAQGTKLAFTTTPIGTITPATRVTILDSGLVGIGTAGPIAPLHVAGGWTNALNDMVAILGTWSSSATNQQEVLRLQTTVQPTGVSLSSLYAYITLASLANSSTPITNNQGTFSRLDSVSTYTGQVTNGFTYRAGSPSWLGTLPITNLYAYYSDGITMSNGITSGSNLNAGFWQNGITAAAGAGGTLTNYSMFAQMPSGDTAGTSNYGIFINGAGGTTLAANNFSFYNNSAANSWFSAKLMVGGAKTSLVTTSQQTITNGGVANSQLALKSQRAAIVSTNVIGGIDFVSDDTNLTAPGTTVSAIQALATATHTASVLTTDLVFYSTTTLAFAEVARMTGAGNFSTLGTTTSTAIITPKIYPSADAVSGITFYKSNGTSAIVTIDTTNSRVGFGTATPSGTVSIAGGQFEVKNASGTFSYLNYNNTSVNYFRGDCNFDNAPLNITDVNIVLSASTGTKIGTATTQKLGFFNATPIVQVGATIDLGVTLSNLGLRAAGTAYPITTSGAVTFGSLTAGRVTFAGASGLLSDDADMTFSVDTLTVTKIAATTFSGKPTLTTPMTMKGYTVATLPAAVQGDIAFVTDALTPTFLAIVVGGGAVVTPVFYNGTNWVGY